MSSAPILLLHGFSGHAESWRAVREAIPGVRRTDALTLFGHDPDVRPTSPVAFDDEVRRVVDWIRTFGEPVRLCGYSMGGRVSLGVLACAPELVSSVVLVGAHPGLTTEQERRERALADEVWVRILESEGIASFAAKWQAQPLFATQNRLGAEPLARQEAIRLRHHARSLALAMASLGLGRMPSYWGVLGKLEAPVDLVVGAHDEKFAALAIRMNEGITRGRGRVLRVADAGHNVLLEKPELLAAVLASVPHAAPASGLEVVVAP